MIEQCEVCPYCQRIPGVGPEPVNEPRSEFDRPVSETKHVVVVPALGMLVPGSFLVISRNHVYSFAHLSRSDLGEIQDYLKIATEQLEGLFGKYLLFEHGASKTMTMSHGGCIAHAHFHLFPVAEHLGKQVLNALSFNSIPDLSSITNETANSYALLGLNGHYYLSGSPNLPSQWIRRMVVDSLGISKHWDWAVEFGNNELKETLSRLKERQITF